MIIVCIAITIWLVMQSITSYNRMDFHQQYLHVDRNQNDLKLCSWIDSFTAFSLYALVFVWAQALQTILKLKMLMMIIRQFDVVWCGRRIRLLRWWQPPSHSLSPFLFFWSLALSLLVSLYLNTRDLKRE